MRIDIVEPIDAEEQRSGEKVPASDDVDCPVCLQPFLEPCITKPCGHAYCRHCILRAACPPELYEEDQRAECPVCRTTIAKLETSPALARLVMLQHGTDYEEKRRKDSDVPLSSKASPVDSNPVRQLITDAIREQGGYRTLALNSKLDLARTGLETLDPCISELSGLRMLRLEHNLLRSLDGLVLPELVSLIGHHNQLRKLGDALHGVASLIRLDLSHNLLTDLRGVELLPALQNLNVAHNRLATAASVEALRECASTLDVLDLSSNQLPGDALDAVGALAPTLRVLYLRRNPLVEHVSSTMGSYRKRLIARFAHLSYLDDQPVNANERRTAEAWAVGGDASEAAVRESFQTEARDRVRRNTQYMMKLKENALTKRRASEAAASSASMEAAVALVAAAGVTGGASSSLSAKGGSGSSEPAARRSSLPPGAGASMPSAGKLRAASAEEGEASDGTGPADHAPASGASCVSTGDIGDSWKPAWDRALLREARQCHHNWQVVAQRLRAVPGGPVLSARECAERWAQLDEDSGTLT